MYSTRFSNKSLQALGLQGVLVTGASSGIGFALAAQLAHSGVSVIAVGRNEERLTALANINASITPLAADLTDTASLPLLVRHCLELCPSLNCVILNAGVQYNVRFDDADYGAVRIAEEVAVNLLSPMALTHLLMPSFQLRRRAWVVTINSVLGLVPKRTSAVYSATKAGLRLFSAALSVQCRGSSVRFVDAILPLVDTPMTAGRGKGKISAEEAALSLLKQLALDRAQLLIGSARAVPWLQRFAPTLLARMVRNG